MTFDNLLHIFESWGFDLKPEHYYDFKQYAHQMLKRHRVIVITSDGQIEAILFFFLTFNYQKLYKKSEWQVPDDNPDGNQIYIDKMICKRWAKDIRRKAQELIESTFPDVKSGYYHRAPNDRCVKIIRRDILCMK